MSWKDLKPNEIKDYVKLSGDLARWEEEELKLFLKRWGKTAMKIKWRCKTDEIKLCDVYNRLVQLTDGNFNKKQIHYSYILQNDYFKKRNRCTNDFTPQIPTAASECEHINELRNKEGYWDHDKKMYMPVK